MKKNVFLFVMLSFMYLTIAAIPQQHPQVTQKKDSLRDIKHQPKRKYVKGRAARMRLQLRQIQRHDKEFKKIDSAQQKLHRELRRKDT